MKPGTGIKIKLSDKYWLTSDNLNYRLSVRTEVEGVGYSWQHHAFHATISGVLTDAYNRGLRSSGAESFEELYKESERYIKELSKHFDIIIEGVK